MYSSLTSKNEFYPRVKEEMKFMYLYSLFYVLRLGFLKFYTVEEVCDLYLVFVLYEVQTFVCHYGP